MNSIIKFLLDQPPRQLYYFLRDKLKKSKPLQEFNNQFPCIFVLSTGRVGTETLDALLGLSEHIFSYHEPAPTLYKLSKLSYQYANEPLAQEILQQAFLTSRIDLLKHSLKCQRGYVETSPQVTFLAPIILEAIPNARFIHLTRNPYSVVRSGMRRNWFNGHPNDETRIIPNPSSHHAIQWKGYTPFQKNAWLWSETNRWILEFSSKIPSKDILMLHSEDVFSMKQDTMKKLYNFVGTSLPATYKIKKVIQKKMNVQKTGEFPGSKLWSPEQKVELMNLTSEIAKKMGYDLSRDNE